MSCGLVEIALEGRTGVDVTGNMGWLGFFFLILHYFSLCLCIILDVFPNKTRKTDSYLMWWPCLWMLSSSFATHQVTAIPFLYVIYFKEWERVFNFLQVKSKLYWIIQKSDKLVILMTNSWLKVDAWHCLSPRKFKVWLVKTEAFGH